MGNVVNFKDIKGIHEIPQIAGYRIVENYVIAAYFETKSSHSVNVYDFILLKPDDTYERLFYGIIQGEEAKKSDPEQISATAGAELIDALNHFAQIGIRKMASNTFKCIVGRKGSVFLIACRCDQGIVLGGWHISNSDPDIALPMLAYCIHTFAAINNVAGKEDQTLLRNAYDTIPNDTRFGKFSGAEASVIRNSAYRERTERMRKRAENLNP